MSLKLEKLPERVVVVGGSSGMGLVLAEKLLAGGSEVVVVGRSADRLAQVRRRLREPVLLRTVSADVGIEEDVVRLFGEVGRVDHVITTAADITGAYRPIGSLDLAEAGAAIASKLFGPLLLAKHAGPNLASGGSLVFTSGIAAYRPGPKGALVAALNGVLAPRSHPPSR
ncbi:MAG: SDR family NAD(P)-dependent oxidoreductase [Mycobacteriales bacterium]